MKMKTIQFSIKASVVAFLFATGVGCTYDVTVDHPYEGPIDFLQLFTGNLETASTTPIAITWNVEDEVGDIQQVFYAAREHEFERRV